MTRIPIALVAALMAGCALSPPKPSVELQTKFDTFEHDSYRQDGTGAIAGQGFLRQKGGGVVTCAGNPVLLMPATPFFREFIGQLRNGRKVVLNDKLDPTYKPIIKQSQCDAQGNFTFSNLSAGTWFVMTEVKWTVGYRRQGGALLREVSVIDGQSTQAILSDNDYAGR